MVSLRRQLLLFVSILFSVFEVSAQYDNVHYIAPSRWSYFNDKHELVLSTLSTTPVNVDVRRSDGTLVTTETVVFGTPTRYTFTGTITASQSNPINTVSVDNGLIVTSNEEVSVNVRNISGDGTLPNIKGNTSLTSKGALASGTSFHLIYYRNFPAFYGMMAIEDGTTISLNGTNLTTLNAGETYLIGGDIAQAGIGDLIESNKDIVMTSSASQDSPGQCADPVADQMIPNLQAGNEYITVRGEGNAGLLIENTTIVATEANTDFTVNGVAQAPLVNAGDWVTIPNGPTAFDLNVIESTKPILLAQGAGQGCEHGMSIIPQLKCTGSNHIETVDFGNLDYSVFVISKCDISAPTLNGVDLTSPIDVTGTAWRLYLFDNTDVTGNDIILDSETPMHVGVLQDGGAFGGFAYFSGFSKNGIDVNATTTSGDSVVIEGCTSAQYVFTRESFCDEVDTILINVSGTADEGIDFNNVPDTLIFEEGVDSLYLSIESFVDNLPELTEFIDIFIVADKDCDGILDTISSRIYIEDYAEMLITVDQPEIDMCVDYFCSETSEVESTVVSVANGHGPYTFNWSDGFSEFVTTTTDPKQSTNTFSEVNGNVPYIDTVYQIVVTDACGNSIATEISIENNCAICAPNVITANGDNINDFFEIDNIEQYPEAKVIIVNRWGNVLLETTNYQNDWTTTEANEGVYFYKVIIDAETVIHGFFHIIR